MKNNKTIFFSAYGWSQVQREIDKLSPEELSKILEIIEHRQNKKK